MLLAMRGAIGQIDLEISGNCPIWITLGDPYIRWAFYLAFFFFAVSVTMPLFADRIIRRPKHQLYGMVARNRITTIAGVITFLLFLLLAAGYAIGGPECFR